ncbi:MAG: glutaredoxin family protein [Methanobacterium sp.]|uniref:glutaredoxin family protein n=1 Tax=Methanobacterium sp. TaxID=2164 RepID=UPI003D64C521|nr:glutaredoxin family protein [Methanobacterium sp.]
MGMEHVKGENKGDVVLYALSTCGWCKKTRMLLEELGIEFRYIYVDLLKGDERSQIIKDVEKYNPQLSFPTVVINNKDVIVGFKKEDVMGKLK